MTFLIAKWLHIVSATVLFGTGLGTAFHMFMAHLHGDVRGIAIAARHTVVADWIFTLTSGILQPATGVLLIYLRGWDPLAPWLIWTYVLYLLALACWLIVVRLQIRMREMSALAAKTGTQLPREYYRAFRWWFILGWPAFISLLIIFWLMVGKPTQVPIFVF